MISFVSQSNIMIDNANSSCRIVGHLWAFCNVQWHPTNLALAIDELYDDEHEFGESIAHFTN